MARLPVRASAPGGHYIKFLYKKAQLKLRRATGLLFAGSFAGGLYFVGGLLVLSAALTLALAHSAGRRPTVTETLPAS